MDRTLMKNPQAPRWAVELVPGQVMRVPAADHARWLTVVEGRVWLTADAEPGQPAQDVWLAAGEGSLLPAGAEAVLEGAPQARFQLVEAVFSEPQRAVFLRRWLRSAQRSWLTAPAALRPCAA